MLEIPNVPEDRCPDRDSDEFATEIRREGTPPVFDFDPLDHADLGERLGILDFAGATRLSGPRFAVLKGTGAATSRALGSLFLSLHTGRHGYAENSVPSLVSRKTMTGTGQLPKFEQDLFKTSVGERELFLIPTDEVSLSRWPRTAKLSQPVGQMRISMAGTGERYGRGMRTKPVAPVSVPASRSDLLMTTADLTTRLNALASERQAILRRITTTVRDNGAGALLLIGSLGRGGGDAFSDLDLIIVPGPAFIGLDLPGLFGEQVLASLDVPRNAPVGGAYVGLCLDVADAVLWLDAYTWPTSTAAIPVDATLVFDDLGLSTSDLTFSTLITQHSDPSAAAHSSTSATTLLRVAVAAKYLARRDLDRLVDKLPVAAGLSLEAIPALLHELLAVIVEPDMRRAVTGTAALVDLADARHTQR